MADSGAPAPAQAAGHDVVTRGVHHLALTTEDMKTTTEFFVNVVGMPLVHAMKVPEGVGTGPGNRGNPPWECIRHYFFDMGNDSLLAFFEIPKGEKPKSDRDAIGGMQHCAFVVTAERFAEIQRRLTDHGVPFDGPIDILPGMVSIYFRDPNGIRLEACCHPAEGEAPGVIPMVTQTRAEAAAELETLDVDAGWIDAMTGALPAER
ncbi:MAG: VOC family protein [Defluviicoccus sp.]|nr:VOC family protein [Defluviicoccus sp.]MDE0383026.1 VOC family protein [Defluviicoccus sp.]